MLSHYVPEVQSYTCTSRQAKALVKTIPERATQCDMQRMRQWSCQALSVSQHTNYLEPAATATAEGRGVVGFEKMATDVGPKVWVLHIAGGPGWWGAPLIAEAIGASFLVHSRAGAMLKARYVPTMAIKTVHQHMCNQAELCLNPGHPG